jgi:hypothetical protein
VEALKRKGYVKAATYRKKRNAPRKSTPGSKTDTTVGIATDLGRLIQTKRGSWINGGIHFFDYIGNSPRDGFINIAYVRDLPSVQSTFAGFDKKRTSAARVRQREKAVKLAAFITMTDPLADHTRKIYGIDIPHGIFRAYPSWQPAPSKKRKEIVYIDNASVIPLFYDDHLSFLDRITRMTGIKTVFASGKFAGTATRIIAKNRLKVTVVPKADYDYGSEYGILMLTNKRFSQAGESLPRKLLLYAMSGIKPLMDPPWAECIKYMKSCKIEPFVYHTPDDIKNIADHEFGSWNPKYFSMEERLPDLRSEIRRLADIARLRSKPCDYERFVTAVKDLDIGRLCNHARHRCLLRHDVDMDLDTALEIAKIEHRHGVSSTYFILPDHPYFKRADFISVCKKMQDMGHEIGYHNNLITGFITDGTDPAGRLKEHLDYLRGSGIDVRGTSAHGVKLCRTKNYRNYDIFKKNEWPYVSLADNGLYEAYSVPYDYYITDSQGSWRITRHDEWHHNFFNCRKHTLNEIIPQIKKFASAGNRLQICTHPCYWK